MAKSSSLKCDFCGSSTTRLRRVALDRGYDRLGQKHVVRYACEACSKKKEAERTRVVDSEVRPL